MYYVIILIIGERAAVSEQREHRIKGERFMKKAKLYYLLIALFVLLFVLGFYLTAWLCILSFIPLILGMLLIIRNHYMRKRK